MLGLLISFMVLNVQILPRFGNFSAIIYLIKLVIPICLCFPFGTLIIGKSFLLIMFYRSYRFSSLFSSSSFIIFWLNNFKALFFYFTDSFFFFSSLLLMVSIAFFLFFNFFHFILQVQNLLGSFSVISISLLKF